MLLSIIVEDGSSPQTASSDLNYNMADKTRGARKGIEKMEVNSILCLLNDQLSQTTPV